MNCVGTDAIKSFKIHYIKGKAKSISFSSNDTSDMYAVYVKGEGTTPMLGEFKHEDGEIVFEPAIPFSNGQAYEIKKNTQAVFNFTIKPKVAASPELVAVYPSNDSVPENLLKMYFVFSKPMQEVGRMLDDIKVFDKTDGKEVSIFLELENELWNAEHTQLTLWLDPGRIKRDLIPNQEKGLPIEKGKEYEISVTTDLKDADGIPLGKNYSKMLYVTTRDTHSPNIKDWKIRVPMAGTNEALIIDFNEPLDAVLAKETIQIFTNKKQALNGIYKVDQNERQVRFYPNSPWARGKYLIRVDAILEDLAGNNLNRLFDQNLSQKTATSNTTKAHELEFAIEF
ncbi:Ig-like domain-containing protein [bacterium]|nr:Ig-like domain-containing protein [bacterium]